MMVSHYRKMRNGSAKQISITAVAARRTYVIGSAEVLGMYVSFQIHGNRFCFGELRINSLSCCESAADQECEAAWRTHM